MTMFIWSYCVYSFHSILPKNINICNFILDDSFSIVFIHFHIRLRDSSLVSNSGSISDATVNKNATGLCQRHLTVTFVLNLFFFIFFCLSLGIIIQNFIMESLFLFRFRGLISNNPPLSSFLLLEDSHYWSIYPKNPHTCLFVHPTCRVNEF